jgi:hypothetical protein
MRFNQSEIIEDILEHIRQGGGEFSDWCVGSAKELQCPSFAGHVNEGSNDGLLYREAYTTYAAEEVLERLVKGCGLRPEPAAAAQTGRIVFVYRTRERRKACQVPLLRLGLSVLTPALYPLRNPPASALQRKGYPDTLPS